MKISTKGRYGLAAIMDMALNFDNGVISIKSISERINISENYLEQLFIPLRKGKLVKSIRGSHGGYILAKNPDDITVKEVLLILEGSLSPSDCIIDKNSDCDRMGYCVTKGIWEKINSKFLEITEEITISYLVRNYKDLVIKNRKMDIDYFI